ncbi:MAG: hypothetical protein KDB01_26280 [Planctomycetaceae bacterium]|nr:hypothetical protein [Planctomycetaceae bacterium]
MVDTSGTVRPIYWLRAPHNQGASDRSASRIEAVTFVQSGEEVAVYNQNFRPLWKRRCSDGHLVGGFDIDQDGWPDFGLVTEVETKETCGTHAIRRTQMTLYAGNNGQLLWQSEPLDDKCWHLTSTTYPTRQWATQSLLFGTSGAFTALPQYATSGFVSRLTSQTIVKTRFDYPSVPEFDRDPAARESAYLNGVKHVPNSHVANGLFTFVDGEERLVFFTSARVLQYSAGGSDKATLLHDCPFLTADRKDLAGRNYGSVAVDPNDAGRIGLVTGTPVQTVFLDAVAGRRSADSYGGIERHVTLYDLRNNTVQDRFFSAAHDNNDGDMYQNRIAIPAHIFLPTAEESTSPRHSRLVYSVFSDEAWATHISAADSLDDVCVVPNLLVWDIRDLDGDNHVEIIASPTRKTDTGNEPAGDDADAYLPVWETRIYRWNELQQRLDPLASFNDSLPELRPMFREPAVSSSHGALFPVLTVRSADGNLQLVLRSPSGVISPVALPDFDGR